jgi:hypothetical protein
MIVLNFLRYLVLGRDENALNIKVSAKSNVENTCCSENDLLAALGIFKLNYQL